MIENRLAALEMENTREAKREKKQSKKIAELVKKTENTAELSRENHASLNAELDTVRSQMRRLKGMVEAYEHKLKTISRKEEKAQENQQLENMAGRIERNTERIVALEKYMGFEPAETLSAAEAEKEAAAGRETEKSPETMYKQAKKLFDEGQMESARTAFEKFINLFPDSDKADNARFWIADSYYKENWYEKAILEYQKVIEAYSEGNKVSAALLKQGYAFSNLGEKANARLILKELVKKYPNSKEAKIAEEKLESLN